MRFDWRRELATALAAASLAALIWQPTRTVEGRRGAAIVVTPGASSQLISRATDAVRGAESFRLVGSPEHGSARRVSNLVAIRRAVPGLAELHVVGWGAGAAEWEAFDAAGPPVDIHFHPSPPPEGIVQAVYPLALTAGEPLRIEGAARGGDSIYLSRMGQRVDSADASDGAFVLGETPPAPGRYEYRLEISGGTASETVALEVLPQDTLRVLVLEAAPSFERSALVRWLGEQGHRVAQRTRVSRERYRTAFINMDREPLGDAARAFDRFDAVVMDGRTLRSLAAGEHRALQEAIEGGAGLILLADESIVSGERAAVDDGGFFVPRAWRRVGELEERTVRPVWLDQGEPLRNPIPSRPSVPELEVGDEAVAWDGQGRPQAVARRRGLGVVTLVVAAETTRWLRQGEREAYEGFWSAVWRAAVAGRREATLAIETDGPPVVDRPISLTAPASWADSPLVVRLPDGGMDTVYLSLAGEDSSVAVGRYWARAVGWYRVGGREIRVGGGGEWRGVGAWGEATQDRAAQETGTMKRSSVPSRIPVPRFPMLVGFVGLLFYLWIKALVMPLSAKVE